jgi:8-oxo-dGTP pyrophosphatase MutT (NUDIX family)
VAAPHPPLDLASVTARLSRLTLPADAGDDASPRAAVAAILREGRAVTTGGGDAEVLLIRRAEHPDDPWSGHMAFPGGRRDEGDRTDLETAIRETREEVGVDLAAHGALITRLADVAAVARGRRTGLTIAPFVFALHAEVSLSFDPAEVSEALWAPLGPLARGEGAGTMRYEVEGQVIVLPCLNVEGHVVWGLTYRMLQLLFEALGGD